MRTLITALSFTALLIGGTAAQSMTIAPGLTPGEHATVKQLVPEASLTGSMRVRRALWLELSPRPTG
jgi:hypothetical protein